MCALQTRVYAAAVAAVVLMAVRRSYDLIEPIEWVRAYSNECVHAVELIVKCTITSTLYAHVHMFYDSHAHFTSRTQH